MKAIEASTLGFEPGEWPGEFRHEGVSYRLLRLVDVKRADDGEITSVVYRQIATQPGMTVGNGDEHALHVFND